MFSMANSVIVGVFQGHSYLVSLLAICCSVVPIHFIYSCMTFYSCKNALLGFKIIYILMTWGGWEGPLSEIEATQV